VEATEPLEGVSETDEPKPEPLLVETSKFVGAVTVIFAVRFAPVTLKFCAAEAVPAVAVKGFSVPVVVMEGPDAGAASAATLAQSLETKSRAIVPAAPVVEPPCLIEAAAKEAFSELEPLQVTVFT